MLLEICVDSLESALAAQAGGADRIELCSALECGGLTPPAGLLKMVREMLAIPLQVLIRPRNGDFCYSEREFEVMREDILFAKQNGAEGVVIGMLLPDGRIDTARTKALVETARPMSVTFHRAFDFSRDPYQALEDIISTGSDRILSSGQAQSALMGVSLLSELVALAKTRIIIMPGAGINSGNVQRILEQTKAREIHLSASKLIDSRMIYHKSSLKLHSDNLTQYSVRQPDINEIIMIKKLMV